MARASFDEGLDKIEELILHVLKNQSLSSLKSLQKLWKHAIDPVSVRSWIEKTNIRSMKVYPKSKEDMIIKEFIKLGNSPRYKKDYSLGLLHKAINLAFNNPEISSIKLPSSLEELDDKFIDGILPYIEDSKTVLNG